MLCFHQSQHPFTHSKGISISISFVSETIGLQGTKWDQILPQLKNMLDITQCSHSTIIHSNLHMSHSNNNTCFVITHINVAKITWLVCGEPLPLGNYMVRTFKIKNSCIYQLTTLTKENIPFSVVVWIINLCHICCAGCPFTKFLQLWAIPLKVPILVAFAALHCFLVFSGVRLLP